MKLTTNAKNPCALKVLAAANIAKIKLELETIKLAPESRHRPRLPILIVRNDVRLFSTNAALTYIMDISGHELTSRIEQLTILESQHLSPLILSYLSEKGDSDLGLLKELETQIDLIEKWLLKEPYLTGSIHASFGDAIIWSCMYPLLGSKDKILNKFPNILNWAERINNTENFAAAVRQIEPALGKEAVKLILLCNHTASTSTFGERVEKIESQNHNGAESSNSNEVTPEEIEAAKVAFESPLLRGSARRKRTGQILPLKGEKNYFITSALPYVNNVPHLGNIIGCVLSADVFARYCRSRGRNVLYISGTDEYGTATETKALEEGLTPQQICDKYHKLHDEIYQWFGISFDYFGRTTTKEQTDVGQDIFLRLNANGYLKEMVVQQLYCVPCQRFLSDRFVEGTCPTPSCGYEDARGDQCDKCGKLTNSIELKNPRCKICNSKDVITKNSDQVFLDLPKLEEKVGLDDWLEKASQGWTPNARNIAKSWMREGLKERCITRDLKWGTPVPIPKFKDKVFYVWFDAPIGYISMTACYTTQWQQWWKNPDADIEYFQFMAKDNVPFHSILFPASLKGTEESWTLVRHIIATEYLNYEEGKFSKSRGYGVFGNDAVETGISPDVWRFYLIFIRPESQDSVFSWEDFMTKNNSELLNNLGNFINRSLTFLEKFFESQVPKMTLTLEDYKMIAEINREITEYVTLLELCKLKDSLRQVLAISKIGNQYFQAQQPWALIKQENGKVRGGTVCGVGVQIVFLLATLLEPFMPNVSRTIRTQLNAEQTVFSMCVQAFLPTGHKIGKPTPLFQKLEPDIINAMRAKYGGQQNLQTLSSQQQPEKEKPNTTTTKKSGKTQQQQGKEKKNKIKTKKQHDNEP